MVLMEVLQVLRLDDTSVRNAAEEAVVGLLAPSLASMASAAEVHIKGYGARKGGKVMCLLSVAGGAQFGAFSCRRGSGQGRSC